MVRRPETRYVRSDDGLFIAYQVVGSGSTDIALLAGFGVDTLWEDPAFVAVANRLLRLGRLILLDFRGFGSSDPVPLGALPTPEDWVDDLRVVLDAAGSERAHVVGHAASGTMAALFVATHPDRAASLTLIDSYARGNRGDDYPFGPPPRVVDSYIDWIRDAWGTRHLAAFDAPSRADDEDYLEWSSRSMRLTQSPTVVTTTMRWCSQLDIRAVLPSVRVPTVVIHSTQNQVFRIEAGRYLAEQIPNARFVERHGRDVYLHSLTEADEVVDQIEELITGEPPVVQADRAFATILFTDVVGSTNALAEVGDERWKRLLDRHDEIVARQLAQYRGRKVTSTGDGVLATFDGPARAVRCARAIVDAVEPLQIELRAGLHAGEVEVRGDDIGGIAVHIGQRVSAIAHPGEVLVSRTVTDLVAGSGLEFEERGEHELKGVPGAWKLFALRG